MRVLIGILCIDRDIENLARLMASLPTGVDVAVATRQSDIDLRGEDFGWFLEVQRDAEVLPLLSRPIEHNIRE